MVDVVLLDDTSTSDLGMCDAVALLPVTDCHRGPTVYDVFCAYDFM